MLNLKLIKNFKKIIPFFQGIIKNNFPNDVCEEEIFEIIYFR